MILMIVVDICIEFAIFCNTLQNFAIEVLIDQILAILLDCRAGVVGKASACHVDGPSSIPGDLIVL